MSQRLCSPSSTFKINTEKKPNQSLDSLTLELRICIHQQFENSDNLRKWKILSIVISIEKFGVNLELIFVMTRDFL